MYQSCCNTRLCCKYVTSSNAVTYLHILRYGVDDYVHVLLISLKWEQPFLLQNVTFVAVRIYDGYAKGGTLGISGWGCAAGSLEPLAFTRACSAEFCYPILE